MTGATPKEPWRRRFIVIAACLLGIGLFAFVSSRFGLRYRGQGLEYWVVQLKQGDQRNKTLAREALQHFGPHAVQPLIEIVERQDPAWKVNLIGRWPPFYRFLHVTWPQDRAYAAAALGELGPIATNAIPALERVLTVGPAWDPMITAALMKIKSEPLEPMIESLTNFNSRIWAQTAREVAEFGTNAKLALPVLCNALTSSIPNAPHWAAAYAIGCIRSDPSLCVPALIKSVKAGGMDSQNSLWALGEFESDARAAIPVLLQKVNDSDPMIRQGALGSLKRILPADQQSTLIPLLKANLNDPDPNLRGAAKHMLHQLAAAGVK